MWLVCSCIFASTAHTRAAKGKSNADSLVLVLSAILVVWYWQVCTRLAAASVGQETRSNRLLEIRAIQQWISQAAAPDAESSAPDGGDRRRHQANADSPMFQLQVSAIHIDRAEFPLSRILFKLTLKLALDAVNKKLEPRRIQLLLNVRSANTCSRQFAGAIAAEEYYTRHARLLIVSGCDDAIRGVSRLASGWRIPVMTAAGFGADLSDKTVHRNLIRLAFSLRAAVEFLVKVLKMFQWRRINLIVDESDPNSLAMKDGIERNLLEIVDEEFRLQLNVVSLDLQMLMLGTNATEPTTATMTDDQWPNNMTELAVRDSLRQSSLFSRINILLVPQNLLRKFMLSVYDQGMANGLYTFINLPLLLVANEDQLDNSAQSAAANYSKQSYATSTGENVFVWRSLKSSRNAQAKQAFESLMSIYLRNPATKAYVYFASRLASLANSDYATTTTTSSTTQIFDAKHTGKEAAKIQLNINPYSASFYDCIQVFAIALNETLFDLEKEFTRTKQVSSAADNLYQMITAKIRNRRFDNMVTGSILINSNGDRDTDFSLEDLNQLTGKFAPVIQFNGATRELERVARIHWSSDGSIGPTIDNVDCQLTNTCPSKPYSKFLVTFLLMSVPLSLLLGSVLYYVYKRISLESQLVDYWWKVDHREVELVTVRRKTAGASSSIITSGTGGSQVSHSKDSRHTASSAELKAQLEGVTSVADTGPCKNTVITGVTDNSAFASSAADMCYGDISLGIYKLNKVALKPIAKFHKSRKLMIELRTLKPINHNNLCRFVGIITDEPHLALVSEFCPKGSLHEFFQNESMVIDWTFKYSIINDVIAGLLYLHSSPIGLHGRLKSSNCLVSSRFVVKLSDYGLHSLHEQLDSCETDETAALRKLICLAPEHLKSIGKSAGSKKGDVYSFGLLLYEIMTNKTPFFNTDTDDYVIPLKSLHEELKSNGPSEKIGPDVGLIDDTAEPNIKPLVELMQQCWTYDANKRPSSLVVGTAIKKITRGVTSKKLLENLTSRMEQYTNNLESLVDAKLTTLLEEKLRTEELLYQFVPKSIATMLKEGKSVEPEAFDCVTVFYSDIVGFTSLSSESSPIEVIDFLSDLYLCFDETLEKYDIFKVDTIGDAYIVASGLPQRNDGKHVTEIAFAALELRQRLAAFKIPHKPGRSLEMRVGIHSGPCIAGIVGGLNMPKYCVFGDTLTTGKFMESSGQPMKIHITQQSKDLLDSTGGFSIEPREPKINKDGLPFQTYWLER